MRCGWGPYFRRTFEVQAGNSPLQGQSKPPAKLVVLIDHPAIFLIRSNFISNILTRWLPVPEKLHNNHLNSSI
ncbi:hypothetical protein DXA18_04345, partial [Dorea sp. AM58-8]